jgi:flavin-binding protein dodecin
MTVARVTKITAASSKNFDDAIHSGVERAAKTLRGITGFHVLEQKAQVANGNISQYLVTMEVTFVLEE